MQLIEESTGDSKNTEMNLSLCVLVETLFLSS
jgi:hypothetical protein